jgi:hypothetical protein
VIVHIFYPLPGLPARRRTLGPVLALTLALAGCATVPPPDDAMNRAQSQLQAARDAGAADYAPVDLGFAQDKFQQAQAAMAARKYADAANLSEESRADADLAAAKARLGAARSKIQSKVHENTSLRDLGEQAAQATPPLPAQPAPAEGTSSVPPEADLPAPSASVLSAPPADGGFQTVPADGGHGDGSADPSDANTNGGHA